MKGLRTSLHRVLQAVGLLAVCTAAARGQPPKTPVPADTLRARLSASGYLAVPLEPRDDTNPRFVAHATHGGSSLRLILDTGAAVSLIDATAAERCKLRRLPDTELAFDTVIGSIPTHLHRVPDLSVGQRRVADFDVHVGDLSALLWNNRASGKKVDGLIGEPLLSDHDAVIEYATATLHLRDPAEHAGRRLKGEWVCVRGERDGARIEKPRSWSLDFPNPDVMIIRDGERKVVGRAVVSIHHDRGRTLFGVGHKDGDLPLFEQLAALALASVSAKTLRLCFEMTEPGAKLRVSARPPVEFDASAGSRAALLEFERVGEPPVEPEPLGKLLARAGYSEVPLKRLGQEDRRFSADLLVGRHKLRFCVDTGAAVTSVFPETVLLCGWKATKSDEMTPLPPLPLVSRSNRVAVMSPYLGDLGVPSISADIGDYEVPLKTSLDGYLGHDVLTQLSAVIDCQKPALYVIAPMDKEWPGLKGDWVCAGGTRDGKLLADAKQWRVAFGDKGHVRMERAGEKASTLLLAEVQKLVGGIRVLILTRPLSARLAELPFPQGPIAVRYQLDGDALKLAFRTEPKLTAALADRLPMTFVPAAGVAVLEFARQPAAK